MIRLLLAAVLCWALSPALAVAQPGGALTLPKPLRFEFVQDRQILASVTLNGHPAESWPDSCTGAIVLDAAFARVRGVRFGQEIQVKGVEGDVAGVPYGEGRSSSRRPHPACPAPSW